MGAARPHPLLPITRIAGFVIDLWNVETMDSDDGNTNQESIENVKRAMRTIGMGVSPLSFTARSSLMSTLRTGVGNSAVVLMHDYAEGPRIVDAPGW